MEGATTGSGSSGDGQKNDFVVAECPIESVVVYRDRAEVCRSLKCKLLPGEGEIIVKSLSKHVDPDSIRVEVKNVGPGKAGSLPTPLQEKSPATIMEVAFQTNVIKKQEKSAELMELEEKIKAIDDSISLVEKKKSRLDQQKKYLNGAGDTVQSGGKNTEKDGQNLIGLLDEFLKFYDTCATKLDEGRLAVDKEIEKLKSEKITIVEDIHKLNAKQQNPVSRDISILLEVKEQAEIELHYSYVVSQASWSPKYDIRVFSNDKVMKLQYQGMIKQNTGEDWQDAKISLSTAMPSVGGRPPVVGVMQLYFRDSSTSYANRYMNVGSSKKGHKEFQKMPEMFANIANVEEQVQMQTNAIHGQQLMLQRRGSVDNDPVWRSLSDEESLESEDDEYTMNSNATEVKESVTNATFEIPRSSTIPSDNTDHKVAIAFIDLQPSFKYQSGGHKSKHSFLTAKVKNTSPYALLAGQGNVFLDNNFISKTTLRGVSPSEVFECYLGVDPAVKVIYNSISKYREQSGIVTKMTTITYRRTIIVKNTRTIPVKVLVTDYLPQSTEDKIKVTLLEPVIKHAGKSESISYLNSKKNVEWDLEIPASKSEELVVRYTVEHPAKQNLAVRLVE